MHVFEIKNMTCGGCVNGVTKAVLAVDPKAHVEVDLASKKVMVESAHLSTEFIDALVAAEYDARSAH